MSTPAFFPLPLPCLGLGLITTPGAEERGGLRALVNERLSFLPFGLRSKMIHMLWNTYSNNNNNNKNNAG